jgi:hypothetical protein
VPLTPSRTSPSTPTTPPTMACAYGPPGNMGNLVCEINGKVVLSCEASNITSNNTAPPTTTNEDGPMPIGVYNPGPPWHFNSNPNRPAIHCNVPSRPGICIHTKAPGRTFGWFPTQGCIRVTPSCLQELISLMKQHKTTLEKCPVEPTWFPDQGY